MIDVRTKADMFIDETSRLPKDKQPRWFSEQFRGWVIGVSSSWDYSGTTGFPEQLEDELLERAFDEQFDDGFDEDSEEESDEETEETEEDEE